MKNEYKNPLVLRRADPWVYQYNGIYYFTGSIPQYDCIELRCATSLNGLRDAKRTIVWHAHTEGEMCNHIWAPELHRINDKWYIYFTAAPKHDKWAIRPHVLECADEDPITGTWVEKGRIMLPIDSFSLDMTTFVHKGEQYIFWAQKPNEDIGSCIYAAKMKNPWTLASDAVMLTAPEYDWEKQGFKVNEGPAILVHEGKVIMTYSASDTGWRYCMGMLWADENADLLKPESWHKSEEPVFKTCAENEMYGPGHSCFTMDGDKHVLVYHCRSYKEIDGDPLYDPNRHARAKSFTFDENGLPVFGEPVAEG